MKSFDELMLDLTERKALGIQQRMKQGIRMRKLARSAAFKAQVARKKKRLASPEDLKNRALKQAKLKVIARYSGMKPEVYKNLPAPQKMEIDNRITVKKGAAIKKIATKLIKKLKKADVERLQKLRQRKNEE